jgi:hypothetical protein
MDESGVPTIASVVVDDSTLPDGVTYEMGVDSDAAAKASDSADGDDTAGSEYFADRARVRFTAEDGSWAGMFVMIHGVLGDDPVAAVRTVLVTPALATPVPPVVDDAVEDDVPAVQVDGPKSDDSNRSDRPDRADKGDRDRYNDRDDRPRDGDHDDRSDRQRDDRVRNERPDRTRTSA